MRRLVLFFVLAFFTCGFGHSADQVFHFPHFGDGGGLTTMFVITNPCDSPASGSLSFFDSSGSPLTVPLATGKTSVVPLNIAARSSVIVATTGESDPVAVGYARVEVNSTNVGGLAVFRFANGTEASVLPVGINRGFWLFVEKGAALDTGVAVCRNSIASIDITLHDANGVAMGTKSMPMSGRHSAKFLSELFPALPNSFKGFLLLTSANDFAAIGLRFGGSILSTLPSNAFAGCEASAQRNLEIDLESVRTKQDQNYLTVTGAVINHDLTDTVWTQVAVVAWGADGSMVGGETTYITGTNRRLSSGIFTNTCLRPGERGYFWLFTSIAAPVARVDLTPFAEVRITGAPLGTLSVISHNVETDSYGWAKLTGQVKNAGTVGLKNAGLDAILLDAKHGVLNVELGCTLETRTMAVGQIGTFNESTTIQRQLVDAVDFRAEWDDGATSASLAAPEAFLADIATARRVSRDERIRSRYLEEQVRGERSPLVVGGRVTISLPQ